MGIKYHPQDSGAAFQGERYVSEGDVWMSVGLLVMGGEKGDR